MRVVIEVPAEHYESLQDEQMLALLVSEVEFRQDGGLLTFTRQVALAEGVGSAALKQHGLPDDGGPAMRLFLKPREE